MEKKLHLKPRTLFILFYKILKTPSYGLSNLSLITAFFIIIRNREVRVKGFHQCFCGKKVMGFPLEKAMDYFSPRCYEKSLNLLYNLKYFSPHFFTEGGVYFEEHERYDAKVFLGFLKVTLKKYPEGKIVMILDNARIHHAKLVQPFLNEMNDRVKLMFLPLYSPELNLIDGLWGWLKSCVINNIFFKSLSKVRVAVKQFMRYINKIPTQTIARLCVKM